MPIPWRTWTPGSPRASRKCAPAYAHTWDAGVVTRKPTCTSTGTRVYTSDAGETMTETIPARAHAPEALPAVAATCTTPGLTEGSRCALCGEVLTAQETIPAAHRYVNGVCTVCGARDPVSAPCPGGQSLSGQQIHRYAARGQLGAQCH